MALATANATITLATKYEVTKAKTGFNAARSSQTYNATLSFAAAAGAGAGAFNEEYSAIRTLAGGASETLDLYGSLINDHGETINFARIKVVIFELQTTTASSSIRVGNAASNPFVGPLGGTTPTHTIRNGGFWGTGCTDATGFAVTNGSTDNLKIENLDGAVAATYRITLLGATS